jgi:hypothetical protein
MSTPLRDLLHDLLFDPPARAAFAADPEQYLGDHGWDGLRGADVESALDALTDELPPDQAARIAPLVADDNGLADGPDDGLAGAIAELAAATSAFDGEALDPGSTLDLDAPDGSAEHVPVEHAAGEIDALDADGVDASDDLAEEDPGDGATDLDELSFGTRDAAMHPTDVGDLDADDAAPGPVEDMDIDPAGGIDFGDDMSDDAPATSPWDERPDEPEQDTDEPDDDVID